MFEHKEGERWDGGCDESSAGRTGMREKGYKTM